MKTNKTFHTYTSIRYAFPAKLFLSRCLDIGVFLFFIYYFHFFNRYEVELDKNACAKKERGQYPISTPVLTCVTCVAGVIGPISSHLDRKSLIYHMAKNRTLYCAGYYYKRWLVITEEFSLNDMALRHDLVSFQSASLVFLVKYQTLARRRPRWRTISDCTWPALVKMETETVLLKTKRISCLRYLRWEWSKPVAVSSLIFPLPHSHPKTCSHDSDIQTERTAEQEWTRMKILPLRVCSSFKIFWKDWHVLTNSLKCGCIWLFCGGRTLHQAVWKRR